MRSPRIDPAPERFGRFWILSINYAPEPSGFAPHVTAFTEYLAKHGHNVTVFTGFPFAPRWQRWPEFRGRWRAEEIRQNLQVVRLTHFIPRKPRRALDRLLMEATYCASTLIALASGVPRQARPDAIVYVGAQPCIAMLARLLSFVLRAPYGIMVNDLATGAARDVGIVRNPALQRALHAFEFAAYRGAQRSVVLCESFRTALHSEGVPGESIRLIRSPVDLDLIRPSSRGGEFRKRLGLSCEHFVVLFAGSMGLKQGMDNVVRAAALVRTRAPNVRWVLVGDGEEKNAVEHMVAEQHLAGVVSLWSFFPAEEMSEMFASADVLLLNQRATVKDTVIPSKLLTYMAAGRPVLAAINASSQGATLLQASQGGEVVSPDSPQELAQGVIFLSQRRGALPALGRANRAFAEQNFDQRRILELQRKFAEELLAHSPIIPCTHEASLPPTNTPPQP